MRRFLTHLNLPVLWPETVGLQGIEVRLRHTRLAPRLRRRLMRGGYETAEREMVQTFLRPGDAVVEMGAGVGIVSSFIGRQVGPEGRLACVEANEDLRADFLRQTALNGLRPVLINGLCCPVWQQPVPEAVRTRSFEHRKNLLVGGANRQQHSGSGPWLNGDEIMAAAGFSPAALVVDVEGAEGVWADTAPRFPESIRTVIVELHPDLLGPARAGAALDAVIREHFTVRAFKHTVFAFERRG
jgi:hypothetical protein